MFFYPLLCFGQRLNLNKIERNSYPAFLDFMINDQFMKFHEKAWFEQNVHVLILDHAFSCHINMKYLEKPSVHKKKTS